MTLLRSLTRAVAMLALTFACYLLVLLSLLFRHFAEDLRRRTRNAAFRIWAVGLARIAGMRTTCEGTPPQGPFLLVANHLSYMDIILLATEVHATFVAQADLRHWPVLGSIFASADTIFIDRGRRKDLLRVMERIASSLDRDLGVIIFPEGRTSKGEEILPFKPSLFEFAARQEFPIHYATITYSTPEGYRPAHEMVSWWDHAPFLPHILRLLRLPHFEAKLRFGEATFRDPDRKALADKLRSAMVQTFTPVA